MKKRILYISLSLLIILIIFISLKFNGRKSAKADLIIEAKKEEFRIEVTTTGELEAKNSVNIPGPTGLQRAGIWRVNIDHIVDEGTVVKKGEYVASLDQSELNDKILNVDNELQLNLSKYTQTRLDTALELRKARNEMINLDFEVQEKEIILEQSQFEPPATIKNNKIQLAKARRAHKQAIESYKLKTDKASAQMQEAATQVSKKRMKLDFLNKLLVDFTILAPEPGMVIYKRSWNGTKIATGSTIQPWDPVVATLPDLTTMVSKTYINEVDISSVKTGLDVQITLDAFPDKRLTGKVIDVANVGEQNPNSDAKVFQVLIEIHESDTTLRPGMTTGNTIVTDVIPDAIFIPIECLHSQGDTLLYVIKESGLSITKQEVLAGKSDSDHVVILSGVEENDRIFLSDPEGIEKKSVIPLPANLTSNQ
ncbi:MAG: efflux RND transporter periplasmic adaptor subunit [Bacteroidetes bacterium]|nr:efflux RND transporter periplasmic adaptor subunit [Bacteroidota bacterium]